jgi:hypothetical protein
MVVGGGITGLTAAIEAENAIGDARRRRRNWRLGCKTYKETPRQYPMTSSMSRVFDKIKRRVGPEHYHLQ